IFVKLDLIGAWSVDCAQPPSREFPRYVVEPPRQAGPVQRQTLGGPTVVSTTIDVAQQLSDSELLVSLYDNGDQSRRVKAIWRIEPDRGRVLSLTANGGRAIITSGKVVASNRDTPWINRCSR